MEARRGEPQGLVGLPAGGDDDAFGELDHAAVVLDGGERLLTPLPGDGRIGLVTWDVDRVDGLAHVPIARITRAQQLVRVREQSIDVIER
ncbi:Uncharacterised protein [Mycobacteroides abscessus subsp. abscessus]|nr:Uncharacterised protein [Mycobacteroides abscessus subsp. abscessus]